MTDTQILTLIQTLSDLDECYLWDERLLKILSNEGLEDFSKKCGNTIERKSLLGALIEWNKLEPINICLVLK